VEVISTPLLKAAAESCSVCPTDLHTAVGVVISTRSTFLWTKTVMLLVRVPLVAVILAVPTWPGAQTILFASHTPPQTPPVAEVTVATPALSLVNVMALGLLAAAPLESRTVADTLRTSPWLSEREEGLMAMLAGAAGVELLLPLPQPAQSTRTVMMTKIRTA